MLVVFTNKSGSTIDMFEEVATDLIKLMGRRKAIPSAINAEDLPEALSALQGELTELNNLNKNSQDDSDEEEDSTPKAVDLSIRAHPLIALIEQSISEESFLMWDYK